MIRTMGNKVANLIWVIAGRLLLSLSDQTLARICRMAGRLVYAFAGDEFLNDLFKEIVEVFESGPPGTDVIRKIVRDSHRPYMADLIQGFIGL